MVNFAFGCAVLVGCITGMGAAYGKVKTEKWHTSSIEGSDKARTVMKSILPVFVTGVLVSLLVCRGGIGDAGIISFHLSEKLNW